MIDTHCSVLCSDLDLSSAELTAKQRMLNDVEDTFSSLEKYRKQCEDQAQEIVLLRAKCNSLSRQ